jgi:hypothetical protein
VSRDEASQNGSALHIVVALAGGAGLGARMFQAVGDDVITLLQLVGILGILSAVLVRESPYPRSIFDVHGSIESADDVVFPEDPLVLRRDGVGMEGTTIRA